MIDGVIKGSPTAGPYSVALDALSLSEGMHSATAKATDSSGNSTTSAAVTFIVKRPASDGGTDDGGTDGGPMPDGGGGDGGTMPDGGNFDVTPPIVWLIAPQVNAVVGPMVSLRATATDDVAVASVDFEVDGLIVGSRTTPPYELTTALAMGARVAIAIAADTSGNVSRSAAVTFTVENDFDAGTTDGGTDDAGTNPGRDDAGTGTPGADGGATGPSPTEPIIGSCGCTTGGSSGIYVLALAGLLWRNRRRVSALTERRR